jgi:hypothetical protein
MRSSLRERKIGRCPPLSLSYKKNWLEDAPNFSGIPPATKSIDYSGGLLPGLVEDIRSSHR